MRGNEPKRIMGEGLSKKHGIHTTSFMDDPWCEIIAAPFVNCRLLEVSIAQDTLAKKHEMK